MLDFGQYTAVLLDMDGTLYRGNELLPGVNDLLALLDQRGIAYACVTNNSTTTPRQYEQKLARMGVAVPASRILTSSWAARRYMESVAERGTPIYCIGMDGLRAELFDDGYFVLEEQRPAYVVVGGDFEFTYAKARTACLAIRAGARFVGTNPDTTFPTEQGIVPGAGSILAMLQAATEVEPFVIGKPAPTMFSQAARLLDADTERTLVVGDRLDTDIAGARAAGMDSVAVLTGVSDRAELARSPHQPSVALDSLPELVKLWR